MMFRCNRKAKRFMSWNKIAQQVLKNYKLKNEIKNPVEWCRMFFRLLVQFC